MSGPGSGPAGAAAGAAAETAVASAMPPPPVQFVSLYGEESKRRGRPPPPPPQPPQPHETYSMFGSTFCMDDPIIQPLDSQGIRPLYPLNFDHRKELKKLNHSVLANFLDLLEILIRCPDSEKRLEKIYDIKLLFIHMHHLINEFRPHQAREALRVTLELQKRQRLDIAQRFQTHLDKVLETINGALQALSTGAELDCKLLVPTETVPGPTEAGQSDTEDEAAAHAHRLDTIMCELVDNM